MKRILLKNQILMYVDANCSLFMDFDTSKIRSVDIILYYVTEDVISNNYSDKASVEPIMFLLQQLHSFTTVLLDLAKLFRAFPED